MKPMNKTLVTFYKPSGKHYERETVEIPSDVMPWDDLSPYLRIKNMHAVLEEGPWGFPLMVPADRNV